MPPKKKVERGAQENIQVRAFVPRDNGHVLTAATAWTSGPRGKLNLQAIAWEHVLTV
jgi:hypothetical protein